MKNAEIEIGALLYRGLSVYQGKLRVPSKSAFRRLWRLGLDPLTDQLQLTKNKSAFWKEKVQKSNFLDSLWKVILFST